jgi:hypothetical protein
LHAAGCAGESPTAALRHSTTTAALHTAAAALHATTATALHAAAAETTASSSPSGLNGGREGQDRQGGTEGES